MANRRGSDSIGGVITLFLVVLVVIAIGVLMFGVPHYNVWAREKAGQAQLAEANWNRQIRTKEAEAAKESAKFLAEAEIERAKGVAEANRIIAGSLEGNPAYLDYLWIQGLHDGNAETIYVPTEAGLPLLESSRRMHSSLQRGAAREPGTP